MATLLKRLSPCHVFLISLSISHHLFLFYDLSQEILTEDLLACDCEETGKWQGGVDLQAQRDIAIPIIVVLLEDIRHSLQTYAALYEHVERYCSIVSLVVGPE